MISAELSDHFTFGYVGEVVGCKELIRELLEGNTPLVPSRQPEQVFFDSEEIQASYSDEFLGAVA